MHREIILLILIFCAACSMAQIAPKPAPVNQYEIHRDGGLIYNPLSSESIDTGELKFYDSVKTIKKTVNIKNYSIIFEVPAYARAYDVIPVKYSLTLSNAADMNSQLALTANCFEDPDKYQSGNTAFDLNIPGRMEVTPAFLGTITANLIPNVRNIMKPDLSDKPGRYPNFIRKPIKTSSTIESGDIVWFKYRFKNTGDTILDPEGFGGSFYMCDLSKKKANGDWEWVGQLYNRYGRIDKYLYPGESTDVWFSFNNYMGELSNQTPQNYGMVPGEYRVKITFFSRWNKDMNEPFLNQWHGAVLSAFEQDFVVEKSFKNTPLKPIIKLMSDKDDINNKISESRIPNWLHHMEEFMTGVEVWQNFTKDDYNSKGSVDGIIYLQVSPWAKYITCKLIDKDLNIGRVNVPIKIDTNCLTVDYKSDHQVQTVKDGMRYPVLYTQNMADMRMNINQSPYPEKLIWNRMKEMKDCGINVIVTTSMPWLYDFIKGSYIYSQPNNKSNQQGDAMKYFLDVARKEGMQVNGWGQYPYNRFTVGELYNWLNNANEEFEKSSYMELSYFEPKLAKANASLWLYQFHRWGDLFYQSESGYVPFDVEDTRGWMRQDVNIRYPLGAVTVKAFQDWTKKKYGTIDSVNKVWNSSYKDFSDIDPEKDSTPNKYGHQYEYLDKTKVFYDWSIAMTDLDLFRSELRVSNYTDTLDIVRKEIPGATVCIRTEGGNYLVSELDPTDPNSHIRHAYYSQRRAAVIADVLQKSDTIKFHSDYVTLPYTPREISGLTKKAVEQGIIPIQLPQYDHMRDIAINDKYGTDYQMTYNLPEPKKGLMMHVLTAVYPWWKSLYEAGGVPGATWEDLECDGVVFETQKKEMRLFKDRLNKSMNTPDNIIKRKSNINIPDQSFREQSKAKISYILDKRVIDIKEQ